MSNWKHVSPFWGGDSTEPVPPALSGSIISLGQDIGQLLKFCVILCSLQGNFCRISPTLLSLSLPLSFRRGNQHVFYNTPDPKPHSLQKGRMHLKKAKEDKIGAHPVKLFYEPVECSRDLWRPPKKGDTPNAARKVNSKSKISKKSKQLY